MLSAAEVGQGTRVRSSEAQLEDGDESEEARKWMPAGEREAAWSQMRFWISPGNRRNWGKESRGCNGTGNGGISDMDAREISQKVNALCTQCVCYVRCDVYPQFVIRV